MLMGYNDRVLKKNAAEVEKRFDEGGEDFVGGIKG